MNLYTIGFTKTTAEHFFERLKAAGVKTLLDVRLWRDGQLSGFAKAVDLEFFLKRLSETAYVPVPILAPTADILAAYRAKQITWDEYARGYVSLLVERDAAASIGRDVLEDGCLLCSEPTPGRCHRRLAAEYLASALGTPTINVLHL
jgi:uncharacterized protein (DUF488 family)